MARLAPVVSQPPPRVPLAGVYAPNTLLDEAELIDAAGPGPEDVLLDDEGRLHTGLHDGRVVRIDLRDGSRELLLRTGARPLGLEWLPDGRLLVCNEAGGLLAVDLGTGTREVLAHEVAGEPMLIVNNATVLPDGTVFFTDSSRRHPLPNYVHDAWEATSTGRLLRLAPDGELDVVMEGLGFANGVTLHPSGDSVLVTGSYDYRLWRIPLEGPDAGTPSTFVEVTPGFTDNLTTGPSGIVWAPMPSRRNPIIDFLHPRPPVLRRLLQIPPEPAKKLVVPYSMVVGYDGDGRVVHNLQGTGKHYPMITGAREHDGWLYLSSVREDRTQLARVRIPD